MPASDDSAIVIVQALCGVLPHGREHAEARFATWLLLASEQALVEQPRQRIEIGRAHRLDRLERAAPGQHRQPREQRPLCRLQQLVTPRDCTRSVCCRSGRSRRLP